MATILSTASKTFPSFRYANLLVYTFSHIFWDLILILIFLVFFSLLRNLWSKDKGAIRKLLSTAHKAKFSKLVTRGILLIAILFFLFFFIQNLLGMVYERLRYYKYFTEASYGVDTYHDAVNHHQAGNLRIAMTLYGFAKELSPNNYIVLESKLQEKMIYTTLQRALQAYQRAVRIEDEPERFVYYYWHLADATSLDRQNKAYINKLSQAHLRMAKLTENLVEKLKAEQWKNQLIEELHDPIYTSLIGKYFQETVIQGGQPSEELLNSLHKRGPMSLERHLRQKTQYERIDDLLQERASL